MTERSKTIAHCHSCGGAMDVSALAPYSNVVCPGCGKHTRVKREFGPYMLVRRHAIGGMSMVFVANDNTLDREVALKILSEDYSADERRIAAFEEEARITASFSHPNVVSVLTTGRAFGRFYIAMELVPGGHFEHQINQRGKIPEKEMLPLAIEVAEGLKAAHSAGLIHRDVKPGNILLDAEGHAKLVDFGLALVTQGGTATATELWATPYYVPPETVEGFPEDFRSDVYAFGATLYHALSGIPSCGEESMATDVLREAKKKVVPLSDVAPFLSGETCRIVERAMAYDPQSRYGSYDLLISDLGHALRQLKAGGSGDAPSATTRRLKKKRRENTAVLWGSLALVVGAGLTVWLLNRGEEKPVNDVLHVVERVSPAVDDVDSTGIAGEYRDARTAVEGKEYAKAIEGFLSLHRNAAVQEPTRTWAGVEAVLACYLDGKSSGGKKLAREVADHLKTLPPDAGGGELIDLFSKLKSLAPLSIEKEDPAEERVPRILAAMLAGLKNWEQGMLDPASICFKTVVSVSLSEDEQWVSLYQRLAADYLSDHAELSRPVFASMPGDRTACENAIVELNTVMAGLKTRGRARFNVRAWQLDLARQVKLLKSGGSTSPPPVLPVDDGGAPVLAEILLRLAKFAGECRFLDAAAYLRSLPKDPEGAKLASLVTVAESSAVFLEDIKQDLVKGPVDMEVQLKAGERISRISIDREGGIRVRTLDGRTRTCDWGEFPPDALIALHRLFVKNPKGELERMRRHECAIAFDWLTGNRERALTAAAVLAEGNPGFQARWDSISGGLPL